MTDFRPKRGPLDAVLGAAGIVPALLAHYDLPFPLSAAADILLIGVVGGLVCLIHRKDYEEYERRQRGESKKRWAQLMGRDKGENNR